MALERFFTARNPGSMSGGHAVPAAPRNMARPGRWIPPGEMVEVQDYIIRGGMLYVGTGMKDPNGTPEPSLINPLCAVQATYGCYSTKSLDYWPNYSVIAPEARGAYLGWLASGKSHPKADAGFVFMYFYGLERRAFIDSYADTRAQDEWPALIEEVRRLLGIYGSHRPFAERAHRFIEMLLAAKTAKNLVVGQGKYASVTSAMPLELKIELGNLALAGEPLSSDKALAWADCDPSLKRAAAVTRLPEQFKKLFVQRYEAQYPDGLSIPVSKAKLMMIYEPASQSVAGFGELGLYLDDIPDVTIEGGTAAKIQAIIDYCNEGLGPYSRYVGRHPAQPNAVEALALLPAALWPSFLTQARSWWQDHVSAKPCVTTPIEVMASFGEEAGSTKDLLPALNILTSALVGLEPELYGKLPKLDEPIVLFQMEPEGDAPRGDLQYAAARVTLQLAHFVAAAEGPAHPDALEFIEKQVQGWMHLTRPHRARLVAYSTYLHVAPVSLATIKKNAVIFEPLARVAVGSLLCRVAQLGQDASPAVVKLLAKLYKMLELDAARLHGDLHAAAAGKVGSTPSPTGTVPALDEARIAALQKDTAVVSALLANIFEDEEGVPEPELDPNAGAEDTPQQGVGPAEVPRCLGLDAKHAALVQLMRTKPEWSRADLQAQADSFGLMLDGALEQINEAAFDALDMPFVEGDDPFEINPDLPENF